MVAFDPHLMFFTSDLIKICKSIVSVFNLDPELEAEYQKESYVQSLILLRITILIGAAIYVSFTWLDALQFPNSYQYVWVIRSVVMACFLTAFWLTYKSYFFKIQQPAIFILMGLICGGQFLKLTMATDKADSVHLFYFIGFLLIITCSYALSQLNLRNCILINLVIFCGYFYLGVEVLGWADEGWIKGKGIWLINNAFFLIAINALGIIIYVTLNYYRRRNFLNELDVINEKKRAERLLLNILPESIAKRIQLGGEIIADEYPEVSIIFADIVNFTELSSVAEPKRLINLLNDIFSRFDRLIEKHSLEKIKTIGDAYMAVGGLTIPNEKPVHSMANFALDLFKEIEEFNVLNNKNLNLRIGIHTGPIVAGVIGLSKFSFDLWGDAVNLASRMESSGKPGRIQLSQRTGLIIADEFDLEARGAVHIKGKGDMDTFFLNGTKKKIVVQKN